MDFARPRLGPLVSAPLGVVIWGLGCEGGVEVCEGDLPRTGRQDRQAGPGPQRQCSAAAAAAAANGPRRDRRDRGRRDRAGHVRCGRGRHRLLAGALPAGRVVAAAHAGGRRLP